MLPPLRVAICLGVALLPFLISHITVLTNFVKPLLVLLFASLVVSNYSPHVYRYRHLLHGAPLRAQSTCTVTALPSAST